MTKGSRLRVGDLVEVLSKEEILRTLDGHGRLDHLPFMPEMVPCCGRKFRVFKRAHKTCDSPHGLDGRRLEGAVHLDGVRCDGQAHGGCQAGCLIFWKEAWLRKTNPDAEAGYDSGSPSNSAVTGDDSVKGRGGADDWEGLCPPVESPISAEPTYVCQSTELAGATETWRWWDLRQYWENYASGNVRLSRMLAALLFFVYSSVAGAGIGLGSGMRAAYDLFQRLWGGAPYPWRTGKIPRGGATPKATLNLHPGDMVRVKKYSDILATLDEDMHNRGMYFDGEMVPYTGRQFRVLKCIDKIIDERTGKLLTLKSDAVILENVTCQARYSKCRTFCSRSTYAYWREIWLKRVGPVDEK